MEPVQARVRAVVAELKLVLHLVTRDALPADRAGHVDPGPPQARGAPASQMNFTWFLLRAFVRYCLSARLSV